MVIHLVPLFLQNALGTPAAVIGLIEGAAEATSSLTKVLSGGLSDRLGARKALTFAGYAVAAAAAPLLFVAHSWPAVLGARLLDRLGKGIRTAPRDALLASSVSSGRRGWAFGLHRAADSAGAFLGVGIAALVVARAGDGRMLSGATFRLLAGWAVLPAALAAVAVLAAREERRDRPCAVATPAAGTGGGPGPGRGRGFAPGFGRLLAAAGIFALGGVGEAFLVLRAQSVGAGLVRILVFVAVWNAVYAAASSAAGTLSDRWGRRPLVGAAWMFRGLVFAGFAIGPGMLGLGLLFAAYGLYHALGDGAERALIADMSGAGDRGTAYGLYHATVGLVALPAGVVAGLLWQGIAAWPGLGPGAPFAFGGALSLVAAGLFWRWVPDPASHPTPGRPAGSSRRAP